MDEPLADNTIFHGIYSTLTGPGDSLAWLFYFIAGFTIMFALVNALMVLTMLYTWMLRRVLGRFQGRLGPNRWGPFGLLQPVADAIKLLFKEDIVPQGADRWVFNIAPVVMFVPVLLVLAVIPFGQRAFLANLNIGVLYVIAVTSITTLAIFMAGWASNNKYAMFGAMRGVAQLISYEVPVVVSLTAILLLAGSLSLVDVVEQQNVPYLLVQPLAFLIFLMGSTAEMNHPPFDLVEAESEIVAGYHIEYSGMKFGLFQLAEFASVLVTSAIAATLFLQGWRWPVPHPVFSILWFLLKMFFFTFIFIWIRATLPRLRIDQVMAFAWKFLFPLSLVAVFATAVEIYFLRGADGTLSNDALWTMALINLGVTVVSIVAMSNLIGQRRFNVGSRLAQIARRTGPTIEIPEVR